MRILHVGDDFAGLRPCGLTLYSSALMLAQVARGHEVSYVFSGRHYPGLGGPRLKRWTYDGSIKMLELIGSPLQSHWEKGTRYPERDLAEAAGEAAFSAACREAQPEIVHIQELARLPSSVIEHAKALDLPVVMTLHDFKTVCAAVRLIDADERRCFRHDVGVDCARNCAGAPDGTAHLVSWTMDFERRRIKRAVPFADRLDFSAVAPLVAASERAWHRPGAARIPTETIQPQLEPAGFQRRRDMNIRRLNMCDRLVAPSARTAEIYASLGVDEERLSVQRLTLPHLQGLRPRGETGVSRPMRFLTLGGCASYAKGSRAVLEAVQELERCGRGGDYRLLVFGHVDHEVAALATFASVSLCGPYGLDHLDRVLEDADVGILPSVWEEVHGFVGIELLAKGIPVIGSALGGIPEYVQPGRTGWLNASATGAELAQLMIRAIDDPAEVERLRQSVRAGRRQLVRPMDDHVTEVDALYAELGAL